MYNKVVKIFSFLISSLLILLSTTAQAFDIHYQYDAMGNRLVVEPTQALTTVVDFESPDFSPLYWQYTGDENWHADASQSVDGLFSVRSGNINQGQHSTLTTTIHADGQPVSFYIATQGQSSIDVVTFSIDGVVQQQWSGEQDFAYVEYPLSSGKHQLSWQYQTSATQLNEENGAWLDRLSVGVEHDSDNDSIADSWEYLHFDTLAHDHTQDSDNDSISDINEYLAGSDPYTRNVQGDDGDQTLNGSTNDESIFGQGGNDVINGLAGNDVINGGLGNDILDGGAGDDTYQFNLGDGQDIIKISQGNNSIEFGTNIDPNLLNYAVIFDSDLGTYDLVVLMGGFEDRVTIKNWLVEPHIYQFIFADSTVMSIADILYAALIIKGSASSDTLISSDGNYNLIGLANNDDLTAYAGFNLLIGNEGDDTLIVYHGDIDIYSDYKNTFLGGVGNDRLEGYSGNDDYYFYSGDGQDVISDSGGDDRIVFGNTITQNNLKISRNGNNLVIEILTNEGNSTDDKLIIENGFSNNITPTLIERIEFSDKTHLEWNYIYQQSLVTEGSTGDDNLQGTEGNDVFNGTGGIDILNGYEGDDTYSFNFGNGQNTVIDAAGTDNIKFGEGISLANLEIIQNENSVLIRLLDGDGQPTGDQITIQSQTTNHLAIETIVFADGSTLAWSGDSYINASVIHGSEFADYLTGTETENLIYGYAGDDVITSGAGNDLVYGGRGDDTINGADSQDSYFYNLGDGHDEISDLGFSSTDTNNYEGPDSIVFGRHITPEMVTFGHTADNDIFISIKDKISPENNGSILIKNAFNDPLYQIELVKYSNDVSGNSNLIQSEILSASFCLNLTEENDIHVSDNDNGNVICGGLGNDTITTQAGNDTFIFNIGDGQDVIKDSGGADKIVFGEGISRSNLQFERGGYVGFIIQVVDDVSAPTGDSITIEQAYYSENYRIEILEFFDGSTMTSDEIHAIVEQLHGTEGADTIEGGDIRDIIYGYGGDDIIDAGNGNDEIHGGDGNDTIQAGLGVNDVVYGGKGDDIIYGPGEDSSLFGGDGNDQLTVTGLYTDHYLDGGNGNDHLTGSKKANNTLIGGSGDDTIQIPYNSGNKYYSNVITGGLGNDTITSQAGNDTFIFNIGDGQDVIKDSGGADKIVFGEGISRSNLQFERGGYVGFIIQVVDDVSAPTGDSITIEQAYYSENYRIEILEFFDGSTMTSDEIHAIVEQLHGTEGADTIEGGDIRDIIYGYGGDDIIDAGNGNDEIHGGDGNDTIQAGLGVNDVVYGGKGDDIIYGPGEDSSLFGGDGNDQLTVTGLYTDHYLDGGNGNDHLTGSKKANNTLIGGSGDDTIQIPYNSGNKYYSNVITGGLGNDTITSQAGDDTFIFNIGDGQDVIKDSGGADKIVFGEGIARSKLQFVRGGTSNNGIVFQLQNDVGVLTSDSITIESAYTTEGYRIEILEFFDGGTMTITEVLDIIDNPLPLDSDADDISDIWEIEYFGSLDHDMSQDSDGDGLTDLEEYQLSTNPVIPNEPLNEVIIDNLDLSNIEKIGTWAELTGSIAKSTDYLDSSVVNDTGGIFEWHFDLPTSATYDVYVWWSLGQNRSSAVPYTIHHSSGVSEILIDQIDSNLAGQWVLLGSYYFSAGSNGYVDIKGVSGKSSADAIKLVLDVDGVNPDSDSDNILDNWEILHFGDLDHDMTLDSDGDGLTDLEEYQLSTNPVIPNEPLNEVIIDNLDLSNIEKIGTWAELTGSIAKSTDYLDSSVVNDTGGIFEWHFDLPTSATYDVYVWWSLGQNRSSAVPYTIYHNSGDTEVLVNQTDSTLAGQWVLLGRYSFNAGSNGYVGIEGVTGKSSADAIKLVLMPEL